MTALLCVLAASGVCVFTVNTWRAVRLAQITDTNVRLEWASYRDEVNGALDEVVRQVGELRDSTAPLASKVKQLESQAESVSIKRVAGVR